MINLDHLAHCCCCIIILLYLLLLTTPPDISFLNLLRFIDLLITPFVSLLEYIDLLTIKKLINLDHLAHCSYYACCFQCFWIFFISFSNLLITIMLMNLDYLVIITLAITVCLVLQSLFTLFCYYYLPCSVVANCFVLLLLSAGLIELTLVKH